MNEFFLNFIIFETLFTFGFLMAKLMMIFEKMLQCHLFIDKIKILA